MTHKILIVDDSQLVLDWAKGALVKAGHEVVAHTSAFGIQDLVKVHSPALILLDINMPALNGNRLCRLLKTHMPGLKVVFYSGMTAAEQQALVKEANADGFIEKSQDPGAFTRAVSRFLS